MKIKVAVKTHVNPKERTQTTKQSQRNGDTGKQSRISPSEVLRNKTTVPS